MAIKFTCPACPVQAEGKIYGFDWYFRSRGRAWSFEVAREMWKTGVIFECWGLYDDNEESGYGAGHMSKRKAVSIIESCLALYRKARPDKIGHYIERAVHA